MSGCGARRACASERMLEAALPVTGEKGDNVPGYVLEKARGGRGKKGTTSPI
jgi:hypothetical protein